MTKPFVVSGVLGLVAMADAGVSAVKDGEVSPAVVSASALGMITLIGYGITFIGPKLLPIVKQYFSDREEIRSKSLTGTVASLTGQMASMAELLKAKDAQINTITQLLEITRNLKNDTDKIRDGVHDLRDSKGADELHKIAADVIAAKDVVERNNQMLEQSKPVNVDTAGA